MAGGGGGGGCRDSLFLEVTGLPISRPSAIGRDTFYQTRLLKALSDLALNTSTAPLGNLCKCLATLNVLG
ncbi:hypothetical protein DUI87_10887 [Hirundo rustica rustica]|uniref:Uncharacterized protein n=1 Tax=Hirundo rustica rustica TaxID=333673 RepID=A0A3M0KJB8_HIRRU|nr:hypothetical protein DUI87_10887 [Hirundo rustica rustica]